MPRFLIDENLSPLLAKSLRKFRYSVKAVREYGLTGKSDEEILNFCAKKKCIIITGDLDFGKLFFRYGGAVSVVLLRSRFQGTKYFEKILANLHREKIFQNLEVSNFLVAASEKDVRIRKFLS